jgi:hypothetical protein
VAYNRISEYACAQRSDPPALMWWSENVSRHVLMLVVRKSRDVVVESRDVVVESRDLLVDSRDFSRDSTTTRDGILEIPRLRLEKALDKN